MVFLARYVCIRVLFMSCVCLYVVFFCLHYLNNYIIYLQLIIIIIKWYFISLYSLNSLCGVRRWEGKFFNLLEFYFLYKLNWGCEIRSVPSLHSDLHIIYIKFFCLFLSPICVNSVFSFSRCVWLDIFFNVW